MIESDTLRAKLIQLFPVLETGEPRLQRVLFKVSVDHHIPAGRYICQQGDTCPYLPLLVSGQVKVCKLSESGREITLYRIEAGESCVLTASCIMSGTSFPALAVAEQELQAVLIPAEHVRTWMGESGAWRGFVFGLVSQRLAEVISVVEEVAFRRMDSRIAAYLVGHGNAQMGEIETTHQEIAAELGTSREVVSRILKDFELKGLINRSRGKIQLKAFSRLTRLFQDS